MAPVAVAEAQSAGDLPVSTQLTSHSQVLAELQAQDHILGVKMLRGANLPLLGGGGGWVLHGRAAQPCSRTVCFLPCLQAPNPHIFC